MLIVEINLTRKYYFFSGDLYFSLSNTSLTLLKHGNLQDDSILVDLAYALTREGVSAFRFDFAGNGESEGQFQYGNYRREADDLHSVVSYFTEQEYNIIGLVGHSKGGNAVLLYASMNHDIPVIVNISGRFALERGIDGRLGKNFMQRIKKDGYIDVRNRKGEFEYQVTEESLKDRLSTDTLLSSRSISKCCRVLTIHGSKDEIVPVEDALMFAANIPNHELHIIAEANHRYTGHEKELKALVLDFIKSQPNFSSSLRPKLFRGFADCVARTVRDEGVLSLWRGNGTAVIRYYPSVALNFSLKDLYRSILKDAGTSADNKFSSIALTNFIAGAAAGCTTLVLIYPLDIAHTRLAADIGRTDTRQFRGICHFVQTIYNKNGIRGIYRGLPASLQGMVVHRGLYFGGFDTAKDVMVPLDSPLWQRWVTAQAVTSMAGLISYPLDTVRRRMMMQSGMDVQMYSSTLDCWRKIYKVEGIKSFYRGALSNMFRSTGAAAILVLYDEVKKFMDRGRL
uniref:Serine aminopeptidase S33 domain-containing protein n=1 Tax=Oryza barthii TaxID=65489 RepID=A0A0D3GA99_9ORYZ